MQFTTSTAFAIISFAAMIHPSIQAAAALRVGASLVGGMLGQQKREVGAMDHATDFLLSSISGNDKREVAKGQQQGKGGNAMNAQLKSIFKDCMDQIKNDGKQTVELNRQVGAPASGASPSGASPSGAAASGAPKAARAPPANGGKGKGQSQGAARISGLPAACIKAAKEVNALPNIAQINKAQGTMKVEGEDTLLLSGGPVEALAKKLLAADKKDAKKGGAGGAKPSGTGAKTSAAGAKATDGVKAAVM